MYQRLQIHQLRQTHQLRLQMQMQMTQNLTLELSHRVPPSTPRQQTLLESCFLTDRSPPMLLESHQSVPRGRSRQSPVQTLRENRRSVR